jgi:hypothetical protein
MIASSGVVNRISVVFLVAAWARIARADGLHLHVFGERAAAGGPVAPRSVGEGPLAESYILLPTK